MPLALKPEMLVAAKILPPPAGQGGTFSLFISSILFLCSFLLYRLLYGVARDFQFLILEF